MNTPLTLLQQAQEVMQLEANSIQAAAKRLDNTYNQAVDLVLACEGRIIVSGMGKSGQIGRKITATFASLGTPSAFVHPAEALYGDLGMIQPQDLILMLSNSGETEELLRLLWFLESQGNNNIVSLEIRGPRLVDTAVLYWMDQSIGRPVTIIWLQPVPRQWPWLSVML